MIPARQSPTPRLTDRPALMRPFLSASGGEALGDLPGLKEAARVPGLLRDLYAAERVRRGLRR